MALAATGFTMVLKNLDKINILDLLKGDPPDKSPPQPPGETPVKQEKGAADFAIEIDFEKGSGSPSRVFRAMSDLIDALQSLDKALIEPLAIKIEPVLLLEDIEAGSVRAWFAQKIETLDDEALKSGDYKKVIGSYLVKAKYAVIDFLNKKTEIKSSEDIEPLERELSELAGSEPYESVLLKTTNLRPSREKLLNGVNKINTALEPLKESDKVLFIDQQGRQTGFNVTLYISPETIEQLITSETIQSVVEMILKVKKPDFLGESQWEFRHETRTIPAKILDHEWLTKFQNGEILIRPGDAIRAKVLTEVHYDFDREVIATHYTVVQVIRVIPKGDDTQRGLFDGTNLMP